MSADVPKLLFMIGTDKDRTGTRGVRGDEIALMAPQSPLYAGDLKVAVDNFLADHTKLKNGVKFASDAHTVADKADKAVVTLTANWDMAYDVLVPLAAKVCKTAEDAASLGLVTRGAAPHHPVASPLAVNPVYEPKKDKLFVNIDRAPGMKTVDVEIAADPITPTSVWKVLDTNGARHVVEHPPKGTLWVRAASRCARGKSDYTTPVSVVIK